MSMTVNGKGSTVDALEAIGENYERARKNSSLRIYQQVRAAVKEFTSGCQPNDRLPSIRAISDKLGVAPVPVQRAITELIGEDVLYAKSGIGLFVKAPPRRVPSTFSGHHTLRKVEDLSFLFHEADDSYRNMMLDIVEKYRARYDSDCRVRLIFEDTGTVTRPDMVTAQIDRGGSFLDLADFAKHEVEKGRLSVLGRYGGILSYVTYYLLYNVEMLDQLGLEKPAYTDFDGQRRYILQVAAKTREQQMPGLFTSNRSRLLLGNTTIEVLAFLKSAEPMDSQSGRRILKLLERVAEYQKIFSFDRNAPKPGIDCFLDGETPVFGAFTYYATAMDELPRQQFNWGAYPVFACDNTLPLIPIYATIDADTCLPMECVKFLMFLQSDAIQQIFADNGFITVRRGGKYLDPAHGHAEAARRSFPGYFEESADNYLYEHILDAELIECQDEGKDARQAFANIFHYSRGYLRNFKQDR